MTTTAASPTLDPETTTPVPIARHDDGIGAR